MRKTGVVLFSLALGLGMARPAPVAADWVCTSPLGTCASVSVTFLHYGGGASHLYVTVQNAPWSTSTLGSFTVNLPGLTSGAAYTMAAAGFWTGSMGNGSATFNSSWPLPASGLSSFQVLFSNAGLAPGIQAELIALNGEGFQVEGSGGERVPATNAPEPATFLLLGTGLVGVAVARRRRTRIEKEEA